MEKLQKILRKHLLLFIVVPMAISLIIILFSKKEPLIIFPCPLPDEELPFVMGAYCDSENIRQGSTVSQIQRGDKKFSYTYTLHATHADPYAGVVIDYVHPSKQAQTIDIRDYTHLRIALTTQGTDVQDIYLKTFVNGLTVEGHRNTYGFLRTQLKMEHGSFDQAIPLTDFKIPNWWYSRHKILEKDASAPNFSKVMQINIQNSSLDEASSEPVTVSVSQISFEYSPRQRITFLFTLNSIYLFLILLLRFKVIRVGKEENNIVIAYNKVELEEEKHSGDIQRLVLFIAENFANVDLTVERLAKGAGVSAAKVPTLLKEKYQMNFKQYLNTIRVSEAKRLLTETDQQIVTIAHAVGYNNIPHFNRTFKQLTDISPKQYRQNPESATELHVPEGHPTKSTDD